MPQTLLPIGRSGRNAAAALASQRQIDNRRCIEGQSVYPSFLCGLWPSLATWIANSSSPRPGVSMSASSDQFRRPRGFTLIELLVVIAIIASSWPFYCRLSSRPGSGPDGAV